MREEQAWPTTFLVLEKAVKPHGRLVLMRPGQCAEELGMVSVALAGLPVPVCVVGAPGCAYGIRFHLAGTLSLYCVNSHSNHHIPKIIEVIGILHVNNHGTIHHLKLNSRAKCPSLQCPCP